MFTVSCIPMEELANSRRVFSIRDIILLSPTMRMRRDVVESG